MFVFGIAAGAFGQNTLPMYTVRIQAIRLADDDGKRQAVTLPESVVESVDFANKVYAPIGLKLLFDPRTDFITLNNTAANSMNVDPKPPRVSGRIGSEVAAKYPGKLVVFFRYGPGEKATGSSFAHFEDDFVAMGGNLHRPRDSAFSHEFGHYLGLQHTHGLGFDTVQEAEKDFIKSGKKPDRYDGDGLSDTLPDPCIRELRNKFTVASIKMDGVKLELPRRNIMSYYLDGDSLSPQQIAIARWFLEHRVKNNMRFPVNADAKNPIQAETLQSSGMKDCRVTRDKISAKDYDMRYWSNDTWLAFRFGQKGSARITLPVAETGVYRLDFYAARAVSFGKIQFNLDGKPLGEPIDLYAPRTIPSGRISLGTAELKAGDHILQLEVCGKNEASTAYTFALDCIELTKM